MKGNAYMLKMSEKSEQTHEWDKQIKYTFQNEKKSTLYKMSYVPKLYV